MRRLAALLVALGLAAPLLAFGATPARAADGPTAFTDYGFGDTDARGMYGTATFFFPVPPGKQIAGPVSLDLDFSHSELLQPDLSTLTVRVNDVSLASTRLTPANAKHGHLTVEVPTEIIGKGLFVEARSYMRLTRDDCEEPTNPALWATVHRSSTITLPVADGGDRKLSDLPNLVIAGREQSPPAIVIPDDPSSEILEAAGVIAAAIGRWQGAAGQPAQVGVGYAESFTNPEAPTKLVPPVVTFMVGPGYDNNGMRAQDASHGLLSLDPAGPTTVYVTGADNAAVVSAARGLTAPESLALNQVKFTGRAAAPDPKRTPPWTKSAASFAQLGIDRLDVAGPGTHLNELTIERPAGWRLVKNGELRLDIDTAPGVRRGASFVQVRANGYDVGTRKLAPGGGVRTYTFKLPGGLLDRDLKGRPKRSLRLQIRTHLQPEQRRCTPLDADAAIASIRPTSAVELPHEGGNRLDLGRFPASLLRGENPPLIVIDKDTDPSTGIGMAAVIGRWSQPGDPAPIVLRAADVSRAQRQGANLVLLGNADAELGKRIRFSTRPVAAQAVTISASAALVASPFGGGEQTALVVHGRGSVAQLGELDFVEQITGRTVAFADGRGQTLENADDIAAPIELAPTLQRSAFRNETFVAGVVLVAFVLSIALVIRFRWWGKTAS